MGAFGEQLRREREKRGVSLGEISESTKISVSFLRALEQEDFERLPGGVFNRGFVRAYCKFVDIDDEPVVADFDAAVEAYLASLSPAPPVVPDVQPKYSVPMPNSPIAIVALAASILLLIIVAIWWHSGKKAQIAGHASADESRTTSPDHSSTSEQQAVAQVAGAVDVAEKAVPEAPAMRPASNVDPVNVVSAEMVPKPNLKAPIRIAIHTNEDSWLSVVADGKVMMEGILPAQNSKVFRARRNMVFKTGNAGGIELSYNGKALPPLGTSNEFRSLTFTPDGPQQ